MVSKVSKHGANVFCNITKFLGGLCYGYDATLNVWSVIALRSRIALHETKVLLLRTKELRLSISYHSCFDSLLVSVIKLKVLLSMKLKCFTVYNVIFNMSVVLYAVSSHFELRKNAVIFIYNSAQDSNVHLPFASTILYLCVWKHLYDWLHTHTHL